MRLASILAACVAVLGGWFATTRPSPSTSWEAVTPVTDTAYLAHADTIYAEMVRRIAAVRPDAVQHPTWTHRIAVHPGPTLPPPYADKWAVSFPQHADGGNPGGNLVIRKPFLANDDLLRHEVCHLITGITDHPTWLFGNGLVLHVP